MARRLTGPGLMWLLVLAMQWPAAEPAEHAAVTRLSEDGGALYTMLSMSRTPQRLRWQPLLHLATSPTAAPYALDPRAFLVSAHLDTRPLYYGQPAWIRLLGARHVADVDDAVLYQNGSSKGYPPPTSADGRVLGRGGRGVGLYCRWVSRNGEVRLSPARAQLIIDRNRYTWRESLWTCPTDITSRAQLQDALSRPRFVTLVDDPAQDLGPYAASGYVAVDVAPVVTQDAGNALPKGKLRLTQSAYAKGEGHIAVCTSPMFHPFQGVDTYAPYLPEWAEFTRLAGATKVFVYMFSGGPVTRAFMTHYEREGLFRVFDWVLSRRLYSPEAQQKCYHPAGGGKPRPFDGEYTEHCQPRGAGATGERPHLMSHHGQLIALNHCAYRAMGRYRWIVIADFDEWLASRVSTLLTWQALLQHVAQEPRYNTTLYAPTTRDRYLNWLAGIEVFGRGRRHAGGYVFMNTFVCSHCAQQFLRAPPGSGQALGPIPNVTPLNVSTPPRPDLPEQFLQPRPSMHTSVWRSVVRQGTPWAPCDRSKMIMDPLWVVRVDMHCPPEFWAMANGTLDIPTEPAVALHPSMALSYHLRNVYSQSRPLAEAMAPLNRRCQLVDAPTSEHTLLSTGFYGLEACTKCINDNNPTVDYSLTNLYGRQLARALAPHEHVANLTLLCSV